MAGHLKEGQGWRLGWSPDAAVFKGLVAGDTWALEMTGDEFEDFCRITLQLATTLQAMAAELMDEERISCQQESDRIWIEVEGYPHQFSLRFILLTGRQAEGEWPAAVTAELINTLPAVKLF